MANAPVRPPAPSAPPAPALDHDIGAPGPDKRALGPEPHADIPPTGVRRVLGAYEERSLQRVRWGAVLAGLVLAIAAQALLGLLGLAIALSASKPELGGFGDGSPLARLGSGFGVWLGIASLLGLFAGGYAAARLGGAIRRADGAVAGVLTWATSLVAALVLSVIPLLASLRPGARPPWMGAPVSADTLPVSAQAAAQWPRPEGPPAPRGYREATRAAWYAFGGACVSLLAAILGGAAGAAGVRDGRRFVGSDPLAEQRLRERDREARQQDAAGRP
jgi:hypothetical protein